MGREYRDCRMMEKSAMLLRLLAIRDIEKTKVFLKRNQGRKPVLEEIKEVVLPYPWA